MSRVDKDSSVLSSVSGNSSRLPIGNITLNAPTRGSIIYNSLDNLLYYGDGVRWNQVAGGNQYFPIFPGDTVPIPPDYIICGAGSCSLVLAKFLTDNPNVRVLVLEVGIDQSNNTVSTQPFGASPYLGTGTLSLNAYNAAFDPNLTRYTANMDSNGTNNNIMSSYTGMGIGGGGLHNLLTHVRPTQAILDGPLPAGIIPPSSIGTSTTAWATAGGSAWSNANLQAICSSIENFQFIGGGPGFSENINQRGLTGPEVVMQLAPFPAPPGVTADVQNALSAGSDPNVVLGGYPTPLWPGGAPSPVVADYNCNTNFADGQVNLNAVAQTQLYINNMLTRQNSVTAFINSIVQSDGQGNLVGNVSTRKLIIYTKANVQNAVKNTLLSTPGSYVASGVNFIKNGIATYVAGRNVVCGMGSIYSALFWQASGIGPASLLNQLNIPVEVNSPLIGQNLHCQYGPPLCLTTTNPNYSLNFPGQSFVQYGGIARRWQIIPVGNGYWPYKLFSVIPYTAQPIPGTQNYNFHMFPFLTYPRSRGSINKTQSSAQNILRYSLYSDVPRSNFTATIAGTTMTVTVASPVPLLVGQLIAGPGILTFSGTSNPTMILAQTSGPAGETGTYTLNVTYDGIGGNPAPIVAPTVLSLDPNAPSSGLSDPDSDISNACASIDYMYQVALRLQALAPADNVVVVYPPVSVLTIIDKAERHRQLVPYITNSAALTSHEAGTVVMGSSSATGACDGNLRLYGTGNCFQSDFAIAPTQNSGNPNSLIQAIGRTAATVIPLVAM